MKISNKLLGTLFTLQTLFVGVLVLLPVAADADGLDDFGTAFGGYDEGSTFGGYDSSGSYFGGYDSGSTFGGYDSGTTFGGYDSSGSYFGGYDSGSTFGGYDSGTTFGGYDSGSTFGGYDSSGTYFGGYDNTPDYSCSGSCGGGYNSSCGCMTGGSNGGFGGSSIGGGSRTVSTGGGYTIYPPRTAAPPIYYPPQQPPRQNPPQYPPVNNVTNNTCTNGSCNYTDNSINGSFNNTSTVTNVNQTPQQPYYPVVYQQPTVAQPYCTISINNYGNGYQNGYNGSYGQYNYGQATLTWSSTNATYAAISGIGQVSTYGTRSVNATNGITYTMTVTGPGGSANCQTQTIYYPTPIPTPVPTPIPAPNLSCRIYASPTSIQNGQVTYLNWNSTGATYATLSDGIGNVAPNGSLAARPDTTRNYVLTVYGYGGSATCNVLVSVTGTTVSLTQIPYTGFDFGAVGNAIYWASLLAFAASLAYLALYFNGGVSAFALAGNALRGIQMPVRALAPVKTIKVPAAASIMQMPAAAPVAPREVQIPLAAITEFKTNDKMVLIKSKEGEAPRLVISRA